MTHSNTQKATAWNYSGDLLYDLHFLL